MYLLTEQKHYTNIVITVNHVNHHTGVSKNVKREWTCTVSKPDFLPYWSNMQVREAYFHPTGGGLPVHLKVTHLGGSQNPKPMIMHVNTLNKENDQVSKAWTSSYRLNQTTGQRRIGGDKGSCSRLVMYAVWLCLLARNDNSDRISIST